MKRHPVLHPLSHDHQNVLARALRLRRAAAGEAAVRRQERDSFVAFAHERIEPHFGEEERLLARAVAQRPDGALPEATERMRDEHRRLAEAIARLEEAGSEPAGALLLEVGELTTAHVRFEERELFELLQQEFDHEALERLVADARRGEDA